MQVVMAVDIMVVETTAVTMDLDTTMVTIYF